MEDLTHSDGHKVSCQPCCSLDDSDNDSMPLVSLRPSRLSLRPSLRYQCGYDCEFLEPPPSMVQWSCSVCLLILRQPHLISCCGQNYCQQCIQQVMAKTKPCPLCNAEDFQVLHNKGLDRSLAQLTVSCSYRDRGCEWTGELRHYEQHLNLEPEPDQQLSGCKYVALECTYRCGGWFHRGAISRHQREKCPQRPFCCDYCRDYTSVQADVVYKHWPVCDCYPMDCPNRCSAYAIERQHLSDHLEMECPLKMVECEFCSAGCDVLVPRQDLDDHLEEFHLQHSSLLAAANQKLQEEVAEGEEQRVWLADEAKAEVARVKQAGQESRDTLWLENAFLKQEMAKLCSEMAEMKTEFLSSLSRVEQAHGESEAAAKDVRESLQSQVENLRCELEESQLSLSQRCVSIQTHVGVFPVEFELPQFSWHLKENRKWQSPTFYSHLEGYRLCLLVVPRGKGRGNESHISVLVCVMKGEYDCRLKWPLLAEITVQLCNQLTDRNHASGVIKFTEMTPPTYSSQMQDGEKRIEGWGLKRFIDHSDLSYKGVMNRQYLKDDRLCFRITKVHML